MSKIYVIVQETSIVAGHGSSADVCILAGPNPYSTETLYPAFASEELARKFADTVMASPYIIRSLELEF